MHSKLAWGVGYFRPVLIVSTKSANFGASGLSAYAEPGQPAPLRASRETGYWNVLPLNSTPADDVLKQRQAHYVSDLSHGLVYRNTKYAFEDPFAAPGERKEKRKEYSRRMAARAGCSKTINDRQVRLAPSSLTHCLDLSLASLPSAAQPSAEVAQALRPEATCKDDKVCLPGILVCCCGK